MFEVDPDLASASTLPAPVYRDAALFERIRERVIARGWQLVPGADEVTGTSRTWPFTLLEGCLDEPLLLTRDAEGNRHVLSNVCTHRGALLAECPASAGALRCRYHGRRFGLDGRFLSMPEFDGARNFPAPSDDLPRVPFGTWEGLAFASIDPAFSLESLLRPLRERLPWWGERPCTFDPTRSRDYLVNANWALYCDNYLEGLHVPFVHPDLAKTIEYGSYSEEVFEWASLQVGVAADGEEAFDLPASSPDHGKRIAGYYFFLFPNTMLNFYPWGLSVNVIVPLAVDRTKVRYLAYVRDPSRLGKGAGGALDKVELEDEAVVESVQKGIRSRLYRRGRFSPRREKAVHHFHRLLAELLASHQC